ncbi:FAD/NAD(P)-binding protein [Streptomyces cavernae]|uniref:FAD/NAD(P)-binding protein n=1 Tax=Streptomyces cavernae TaxID=2259034 RepID=UPI000FEB8A99|nr:FAD/NAD(P)-binding domain-containing protein [Streptomyces cavernae]
MSAAIAARSVAVVGAGPRGTSVLERLCASAPELLPARTQLIVHVVDPWPPGPGRVWRTAQSPELLMNTVASQVTLFTDETVDCSGPIRPGPSLYEWAKGSASELGPDDYPTRALYGRYLEWFFARVVHDAPPSVRVEVHRARAVRLDGATDDTGDESVNESWDQSRNESRDESGNGPSDDAGDGPQTLLLDDGRELTGLSAVVLTQGHLPAVVDPTEYPKRPGLRHLPPANPADLDLSPLAPGEPVLLRGLGLNFFDHMALLTQGRGGRFTGRSGALRYLPSGREPKLYAGSRRGIPYHARGDNAKGPYGRHLPLVLTPEVVAGFRKRADSGDAPDFRTEIWPLVAKEVEGVYYSALLGADFGLRFLAVAHRGPEEAALLDEFGVPEARRWCWDRLSRPYKDEVFTAPGDFRRWLLGHLRADAAEAALGNVRGPLKAALDVLRDLRNELRQIVDHRGIAGSSRREHLDRWYTPLNAYLSIGPPRRRIEEMAALIEAGVLEVVGPRLQLRAEDGAFVAHSPDVPGSTVRATTLIEARLPEPDLRRSADALLARLLRTGQCRPHTVDGYETGGLDVTPRPYRLIDRRGRPHPRRFALGVPTEGVHWVTAAGARPGVDSVTLSDADAVARAVLRTLGRPGHGGSDGEAEAESWPNVELASID